jgi:hypothetical protein
VSGWESDRVRMGDGSGWQGGDVGHRHRRPSITFNVRKRNTAARLRWNTSGRRSTTPRANSHICSTSENSRSAPADQFAEPAGPGRRSSTGTG